MVSPSTTRVAAPGGSRTRCVAVFGTGNIGMRHLDLLRRWEDLQPLGVPTRVEWMRSLEGMGVTAAESLEAAAAKGATLCVIATDTGRHAADALAAIALGMDVFIEKPLASSAEEGHAVLQAAARRDRHVTVGCVLRFSESLNTFRTMLPAIGQLHTVHVECRSYLPSWRPQRPYQQSYSARPHEGGVLLDLIHEIDYVGWLYGWPSAVQASLRNLGRLGISAEEVAQLYWDTPNGALISVALDYLSQPPRRQMRAYGAHGTLEWDGIAQTVTLSGEHGVTESRTSTQSREAMFLAQAHAVLSGGLQSPLATGTDGVRALAVCDAARRASVRKGEEPIRYP